MSEPQDNRIPCVGCGALNPPGVDACIGCGYRFAGPVGGSAPPSPATSSPPIKADGPRTLSGEPYNPYTPPQASIARQAGTVLGWGVVIILAALGFVFAFFQTCLAVTNGINNFVVGLALGLAAGLLVVFGILRLGRYLLKKPKDPGHGQRR